MEGGLQKKCEIKRVWGIKGWVVNPKKSAKLRGLGHCEN